eukprot:TRINITY_DN2004_c1_g1_i4.p1 TRINITY_DN2004_c1_g1~~TRINITY_DN2004_c1_g1_i4.p1  ORF type:complete len:697 (-),score=219.27 TRINITY_DN2004_c1_g1_i4:243-2333(-)
MGNASSDGSKAADEAHAARLQTVTSFVELAGTFFPALSLDTLVFVPRSVLLDGQRKVLPLYGEVQRHLVDYNKVCAKHPNAKLLYLSYIPAERVPDKFGQRRSILGSEERQLWEELFSAVATFLQDHTEFAFVWAPRCCLGGAKATLPGGANMLEHCNPLALLACDTVLLVPPQRHPGDCASPTMHDHTDLRCCTDYPWVALETIYLHLAGAQGYVLFRHEEQRTYSELAGSDRQDVGKALCGGINETIDAYALCYEDPVRKNWEHANLQNTLMDCVRKDVSGLCQAGGALRQAICSMSVTQPQAVEFTRTWHALLEGRWNACADKAERLAVLNLLHFGVAFFEGRIAPPRAPGYAEATLLESLDAIPEGEGGGLALDLWMKDLSPLDLCAVLEAARAHQSTSNAGGAAAGGKPTGPICRLTVGSSHSGGAGVGEFLAFNRALHTLEIEWEAVRDVEHICEGLRHAPGLLTLNLTHNSIGAEGGVQLARALMENTSLLELDIRENMVGSSMGAIADSIKGHRCLETLHVEDNGIGDEGACAVAEALNRSLSLKYVFLDGNNIGDPGGRPRATRRRRSSSARRTGAPHQHLRLRPRHAQLWEDAGQRERNCRNGRRGGSGAAVAVGVRVQGGRTTVRAQREPPERAARAPLLGQLPGGRAEHHQQARRRLAAHAAAAHAAATAALHESLAETRARRR